MAIYRGPGGSGDATQDAASEVLLAIQARDEAVAAKVAAEAAQVAAELAETNAETAETNAETAETAAEAAQTAAEAAQASAEAVLTDPDFVTVVGIEADITTVAGIAADVTTVAGISADVTTVAGINQADLAAVAAIDTDVTTVAGIAPNVTTVAGISSNVTTVAGISANVTTVAGISANVTTVANNNANVTTVATNIASVNTNATNIANINQNAANITAIQNASANATAAANSATAAATSATNAATSAAQASAVALGNEPVRHSVRPSLLLDFANTKTLDPRITFTRASTGTFYDGKTVAKAEENLLLQSQTFETTWATSQSTLTANSSTAPDGTTTADLLIPNTTNTTHFIVQVASSSVVGLPFTVSVYAKASGYSWISIYYLNSSIRAWFDVTNGVTGVVSGGTSSITSVGNGWYRCVFTYNAVTTADNIRFYVGNANDTLTFSGDGTSGILLWGAQAEVRSSVTAYTATTTAPITNYIPALQTAASGVARFEHNPVTGESLGLEIEEQRTNLLLRSEEFQTTWAVSGTCSITTNTVVAPDGTLTADKFILDSTAISGSAAIIQSATKPATSAPYTASIYIKAGEFNSLRLIFRDAANSANFAQAYFNAATGTTSSTSAGGTFTAASSVITAVGNGWYRCSLTATTSTETSLNVRILNYQDGTGTATGNGFSGIYIWGAQLEAGASATSYIKTEGSQVTRSADAASMTGTNFSSWYRADEGTVYTESTSSTAGNFSGIYSISSGATANRMESYFRSGVSYGLFIQSNSVTQVALDNPTFTSNTFAKNAGAYKVNDFAYCANAQASVGADTAGVVPVVDRIYIGSGATGAVSFLNGTIKKIAYYPKRLTNAELQGLTTV